MGANKFKDIFDVLRSDIVAGKYAGGEPLPSAPALMRRFGVARATAVAALKELERCGFAKSRRGKGTFPANRTVGMILPGVAYSEFFLPVMSGISRRCQEEGYGLLFGDAYSDDPVRRAEQAKALAEDFARKRVSGVIFQPVALLDNGQELNAEIMSIFDAAKIPVVLIDNDVVMPPERSRYDLIGINNFEAGRKIGAHLASAGAKRICFLVHAHCAASVRLRCDGVIFAAREVRRVKVFVLDAEPDDASAVRKFIAQTKPDAFVCGNDKTAARLRQTLARLGRKVPEEIMLAGFDDVQIASVMTPQLTTVRQPCEGIADAALSALLERMRRPDLQPREILLPARLVARESTRHTTQQIRGRVPDDRREKMRKLSHMAMSIME